MRVIAGMLGRSRFAFCDDVRGSYAEASGHFRAAPPVGYSLPLLAAVQISAKGLDCD